MDLCNKVNQELKNKINIAVISSAHSTLFRCFFLYLINYLIYNEIQSV